MGPTYSYQQLDRCRWFEASCHYNGWDNCVCLRRYQGQKPMHWDVFCRKLMVREEDTQTDDCDLLMDSHDDQHPETSYCRFFSMMPSGCRQMNCTLPETKIADSPGTNMPSQKTSCLPTTILNQGAIFVVGSLHQQIGPFNWLRQPRGQPDVPRLLHLGEGWWGNWLSPKEVEVLVVFFWFGWSHDWFFWGLGGFTASLICSKCFCAKFAKPNTRLYISKQKKVKV